VQISSLSEYLDGLLYSYLNQILEDGEIFSEEIKTEEDICERFSIFYSLRRASNTRALNQGASSNDIDIINQ